MTVARSHPFAVRWLVATVLIFAITLMWAIASPVPAGPDEEAQLIKSAAVAHGTLIGTPVPGTITGGTVIVKVPATVYNARHRAACDYNIHLSAACTHQVVGSGKMVTVTTYEGRYPPLYYLLTGLPTLVTSAPWVLHAMRAVAALIVAVLIGLAFACVGTWGRSSLLAVALAITVTPTALYMGGVVNPSGMEIGGGILLWAALTVMVMHRSDDPPLALVVSAIAGAVALCASRPLSTGFFALIVVTFVALRPRACVALFAFRRIKIALVVSFGFAFLSGLFVLFAKSYKVEAFKISKRTTSGYVLAVLGHSERVLRQVVGAFGSPNFSVPVPILAVWFVAGFGIIVAALMLIRRRDALVLLALVLLFGFILPFVIIYSHVRTDGVIWQGRYSLPLIAGLPILSGALLGDRYRDGLRRVHGRVSAFFLVPLCFGWIGAFYWYLRRYTVSLDYNATNAFRHDANYWPPVIPAIVVFVILVIATLLLAAWVLRQAVIADRRPDVGNGPSRPGQTDRERSSSQAMSDPVSPAQPL